MYINSTYCLSRFTYTRVIQCSHRHLGIKGLRSQCLCRPHLRDAALRHRHRGVPNQQATLSFEVRLRLATHAVVLQTYYNTYIRTSSNVERVSYLAMGLHVRARSEVDDVPLRRVKVTNDDAVLLESGPPGPWKPPITKALHTLSESI